MRYILDNNMESEVEDCHETYRDQPPSAPPYPPGGSCTQADSYNCDYTACSNVFTNASDCATQWDLTTRNEAPYNGLCKSHFGWAYGDSASANVGNLDGACNQFAAGNEECGACGSGWVRYWEQCVGATGCTEYVWHTPVTDIGGNTNSCGKRILYVYNNRNGVGSNIYTEVNTFAEACERVAGQDTVNGVITTTECAPCSTN